MTFLFQNPLNGVCCPLNFIVTLEEFIKRLWTHAFDFQLMLSGKKFELRHWNEVHRVVLQGRFFDLRWNEKSESSYAIARKFGSVALALPNGMTVEVMLNQLKAGIPPRLRDQPQLITESFDEVVSRLSRVSSPHLNRESVRKISEKK